MFSRVGGRIWVDHEVNAGQRVQPYVEANWLHNTREVCSVLDGTRACLSGERDRTEVLAGVTGQVSPGVSVTAQAGGRFGSQGSRDMSGGLNVSVTF